MNRFLSVVLLSILVVSGAWAYPAGERAGITHDGILACPVVGSADLQLMATEPLLSQYPMSPVALCGQAAQSAPVLLAQYWGVCRWGVLSCELAHPHYQGEPCCCRFPNGEVYFCGTAQPS